MSKVTFKKNGDVEVKKGAFTPKVVGTWKKSKKRDWYTVRMKDGFLGGNHNEVVEMIKKHVI